MKKKIWFVKTECAIGNWEQVARTRWEAKRKVERLTGKKVVSVKEIEEEA